MKIQGINDGNHIGRYNAYKWVADSKRDTSAERKALFEKANADADRKATDNSCTMASVTLLNERALRGAHWQVLQAISGDEAKKTLNSAKYRIQQELAGKIVLEEKEKLCVFDMDQHCSGAQLCDTVVTEMVFNKGISSKTGRAMLPIFWANAPRAKGFCFFPNKPSIVGGAINLWRGFTHKRTYPVPDTHEHIKLWKDHVLNILCGGNEAHAAFTHKWLAHLVQNPAALPRQMLCFSGGQRTGKSLAFEIFAETIGEHLVYQTQESQGVLGRFTESLTSKLLVVLDEGIVKTFLKDEDARSRLRGLVASKWIDMEAKFGARRQIQNFLRIIAITNSDAVVQLAKNEARYTLIKCADADYYEKNGLDKKAYIKALKAINRAILFGWYNNYDCNETDFEMDAPESDEQLVRSSFLNSMSVRDRTIYNWLADAESKGPMEWNVKVIKVNIIIGLNQMNERANWDALTLGMALNKHGIAVERNTNRSIKVNGQPAYHLKPLKEAREAFSGKIGASNLFEEENQ